MIPVLFDADTTVFDSNGIGKLSSAEDCTVIEAMNSKYELELKYHVKGIHFGQIQQRAIILAQPAPGEDLQPFRVYRITKPLNSRVTVYAKHLAYDNVGITTDPFSVAGANSALKAMKNNVSVTCPFEFTTDIENTTTIMTSKVPTDIWTLLGNSTGSMLDVFGGEYLFDGYNVSLLKRRGQDRGVTLRYGKNLTTLEQDENIANCYTAVHPYWYNSDGEFLQLSERVVNCDGNYGYTRVMPLDLSKVWKEKPTEAQMSDYTAQYIIDNDIGKPKTSWKISYVQLEQTEEYKGRGVLEKVLLGDTVSIEYTELGISTQARVNEVRYKPLLGRYESISLGDVKPNMASTIAGKPSKSYADKAAQSAVDAQTQKQIFCKLTNGGQIQGIFMGDDGKIYLNITYAVTGTLDAKVLNVINLAAESMTSGKLIAKNGMSYFDLDSGKFVSVDANQNATIIQGGTMWLENSAGIMQLWITRSESHCNIWMFDSDGNYIGGIGTLNDNFLVYAPDENLNGQIVGHPTVWKSINGEKVLCASS